MSKGKLITVEGDVTNLQFTSSKEIAFIPHCCNNGVNGNGIGVMGAGVAKALRDKWPSVWDSYKIMENASPNGLKNRLGEICHSEVAPNIVVVNMIGQDGITSPSNPKPVKYWALQKCMEEIRMLIGLKTTTYKSLPENLNDKPVIHTPEFGGLRAGGNFDFILELIKEQWIDHGIDVVVYKFKE